MMYRYLFRFVVMCLTILTVNLITEAINDYLISYKNLYKPVLSTLLGMLIVVAIFYPLFIKLESWIKDLSGKVIRSGKSLAGKYLGLSLIFIAGLIVLFYFYAKMWYNIDFFQVIIHGNLAGYL